MFSPFFDSPFSLQVHFYFIPPPLLYPTLKTFLCVLGCGEHLGNRLLAGSVSLLSIPPFLLLAISASFLPLLYVTPWTSLRDPDCGEHIGKWLLASLLSPLLIPPLLLLVTSISLLPLRFSMWLCEPLWVSLTVEKLFIINLDVLLSVLYRWRSFEATVKIRLKTRSRRLKSKSWKHQRTPDSREH